jgi:putative endonuclease
MMALIKSLLPFLKKTSRSIGEEAEQAALRYLEQEGLRLVETNYRCKGGEIDLIMQDKSCLVFVEVRYRSGNRHGSALDSIDQHKQRRITLAAEHYLSKWGSELPECRIDTLTFEQQLHQPVWIQNAF